MPVNQHQSFWRLAGENCPSDPDFGKDAFRGVGLFGAVGSPVLGIWQ
jgi:hypothetical protein